MSAPKRRFQDGPDRDQLLRYKSIFFVCGFVPAAIFTVRTDSGLLAGLCFEQIETEPLCPDESVWGFRGLAVLGPVSDLNIIPVEGMVNVDTREGYFCRLPDTDSEAVRQAMKNSLDDLAIEIADCDL